MNNRIFNHPIYGKIQRINKKEARKMYNHGGDIIVSACNLNPESPFCIGSLWNINVGESADFDKMVNYFEVYNCDNYSGKYAAFYKEV